MIGTMKYTIEDVFDQGDMITYYCLDDEGNKFTVFVDHDETMSVHPEWDKYYKNH